MNLRVSEEAREDSGEDEGESEQNAKLLNRIGITESRDQCVLKHACTHDGICILKT